MMIVCAVIFVFNESVKLICKSCGAWLFASGKIWMQVKLGA